MKEIECPDYQARYLSHLIGYQSMVWGKRQLNVQVAVKHDTTKLLPTTYVLRWKVMFQSCLSVCSQGGHYPMMPWDRKDQAGVGIGTGL